MPNFCMTFMHARILLINLFIITVQTFMMVSGTMVDRWLRSAVQECKGIVWLDPYDDGRVEAHLLMTGFTDGYTRG